MPLRICYIIPLWFVHFQSSHILRLPVYNIVKYYNILTNSLHINIWFLKQKFNTRERSKIDIPGKRTCFCTELHSVKRLNHSSEFRTQALKPEASKFVSWRGHSDQRYLIRKDSFQISNGLNHLLVMKEMKDYKN